MVKTLIFTATYNEFPNIKLLLKNLNNLNVNFDILIIDDNSTDGTLEFLKSYNKKKYLKLIVRKKKLGLDTAHKIAFNYAKKKSYINLITMDADLSHDPRIIPKIINLLKIKTFIIGSRYAPGGRCDLKGLRLLLSVFGNLFIKFLLNINSNEFTTSYRGFNLSKLNKFNLSNVKSSGYSFFMETIFLINKHKISIYEYPIHFKSRFSGKSKIPKIEILRTLFNVIRLKFSN
jgi:dolichol-phosphate mannosyltransferase